MRAFGHTEREESVKKTGLKPHTKELRDIDFANLEISKEMVALQGEKK